LSRHCRGLDHPQQLDENDRRRTPEFAKAIALADGSSRSVFAFMIFQAD
jgi:hypothetical protein